MRKLLLKILPSGIIELYKNYRRSLRKKRLSHLEKENRIVTQEVIENALAKNGIHQGDTVMLHSSLSKIGFVKGGAETVIQAFLKVIGGQGTLVMPSFPAVGYNYDYLNAFPVFDIKNTPSKMGVITEVFRKMKGVKRSFHPTDSVCALGPQAEYLTSTHFGRLTPYDENSPFFKLTKLNAKIVMIGVTLDSLTNLHTLEDAVPDFKFPVYHSRIFDCKLVNENNEVVFMKTKCHDPNYSKKRKCNELLPLFKSGGFLSESVLGETSMLIIEAEKMHEWMIKNYREKGITMYTPKGS
ncbi:MAG: AAC(3) family N-acetyltransferase [Bacteroidetes bacterium]|nr:AAC(3) family N-acetyltransferase [Bacteroidota bacterium]